jgi:nucleotide-binding universal stress UspA family protein
MKILVCTDGSEHSQKALEEASIIAKGCNADEVVIIHVYEIFVPLISFSAEQMESIRRLTKERKKIRKKMLSDALKFFKEKNIKARTVLKEGHPADTIIKVAHDGGFDMIVIGSRGVSGLQKLFLGSVSNAVIHEAKNCSVLIVK